MIDQHDDIPDLAWVGLTVCLVSIAVVAALGWWLVRALVGWWA